MLTDRRGFSILEIAVVMVIVGLLVGFGASLIRPLAERAKRMESKEAVKAAVETLIGHAATNGLLPTWGDNTPDAIQDEFCEIAAKRRDAVSKPLYYFVDASLTAPGSVCGIKSTRLTVCRDAGCMDRIQNVAFIVVSGAENFNPQTGISPAGCPAGQICVSVRDIGTPNIDNCTAAGNCPNYEAAENRINRPEEYDDIVEWVTLHELRAKAGCKGPQLTILNNELPQGSMSSPYSATIHAEGGIPFTAGGAYKWCVEFRNRDAADGPPGGLTVSTNLIRYPDNSGSPTQCGDRLETDHNTSQADNLVLSAAANLNETGSFLITVTVRDNSNTGNDPSCNTASNRDNCAVKSFVLTINP